MYQCNIVHIKKFILLFFTLTLSASSLEERVTRCIQRGEGTEQEAFAVLNEISTMAWYKHAYCRIKHLGENPLTLLFPQKSTRPETEINIHTDSPLHFAFENKYFQLAQHLIEFYRTHHPRGLFVYNTSNVTPLHQALRAGTPFPILAQLLDAMTGPGKQYLEKRSIPDQLFFRTEVSLMAARKQILNSLQNNNEAAVSNAQSNLYELINALILHGSDNLYYNNLESRRRDLKECMSDGGSRVDPSLYLQTIDEIAHLSTIQIEGYERPNNFDYEKTLYSPWGVCYYTYGPDPYDPYGTKTSIYTGEPGPLPTIRELSPHAKLPFFNKNCWRINHPLPLFFKEGAFPIAKRLIELYKTRYPEGLVPKSPNDQPLLYPVFYNRVSPAICKLFIDALIETNNAHVLILRNHEQKTPFDIALQAFEESSDNSYYHPHWTCLNPHKEYAFENLEYLKQALSIHHPTFDVTQHH